MPLDINALLEAIRNPPEKSGREKLQDALADVIGAIGVGLANRGRRGQSTGAGAALAAGGQLRRQRAQDEGAERQQAFQNALSVAGLQRGRLQDEVSRFQAFDVARRAGRESAIEDATIRQEAQSLTPQVLGGRMIPGASPLEPGGAFPTAEVSIPAPDVPIEFPPEPAQRYEELGLDIPGRGPTLGQMPSRQRELSEAAVQQRQQEGIRQEVVIPEGTPGFPEGLATTQAALQLFRDANDRDFRRAIAEFNAETQEALLESRNAFQEGQSEAQQSFTSAQNELNRANQRGIRESVRTDARAKAAADIRNAYVPALTVLEDYGRLSAEVNRFTRVAQEAHIAGLWAQRDPAVALFKAAAGQMATISRAFGDVGALSEGDVERSLQSLPALMDSAEVARNKLKRLKKILTDSREARLANLGSSVPLFIPPGEKNMGTILLDGTFVPGPQ